MGEFGTGKTAFATTVGAAGEVIDLDNGLRTVMRFQDEFTTRRQQIEVKPCWEPEPEKAIAFKKAFSYIRSAAEQCRKKTYKYKVLIIDSWTTFTDASVRDVLALNGMLAKGAQPQIQHWGASFSALERVLLILKSLPISVVLIAHTRRVSVDGVLKYEMASPGQKLPPKIPTFFDEIWCCKVRGPKDFILQTATTSSISCRTRSGLADKTPMSLGLPEVYKLLGWDMEKFELNQVVTVADKSTTKKEEKPNG